MRSDAGCFGFVSVLQRLNLTGENMNKENELTAALATIEKFREITNCPDGVDLQDWLKRLAAENVALKTFCKNAAFDADYEAELGMESCGFTDALNNIEIPATDRIVAGIKADGVEMFVEKCREKSMQAISSDIRNNWWLAGEHAEDFAKQLREGPTNDQINHNQRAVTRNY